MKVKISLFLIIINFVFSFNKLQASVIQGIIKLDNTWDNKVYLSHIKSFDDMYLMSSDVIIAETSIDSKGNFKFDLDYLPKQTQLYRLHIVKKGDVATTLTIGGNNENHLFVLANKNSIINLNSGLSAPPFDHSSVSGFKENIAFHQLRDYMGQTQKGIDTSSISKRNLLKKDLQQYLFKVVDTTDYALVGLYALNAFGRNQNSTEYQKLQEKFLERFDVANQSYFNETKFTTLNTNENGRNHNWIFYVATLLISTTVIVVWMFKKQKSNYQKLSSQERKVFDLVKLGKTNQEVANALNIEITTVKSHMSSIFNKMKIKSRKEILDKKIKLIKRNYL